MKIDLKLMSVSVHLSLKGVVMETGSCKKYQWCTKHYGSFM